MHLGIRGAPAFEPLSEPVVDRMLDRNRSRLNSFEIAERVGFQPFKGWSSIPEGGEVQGDSEKWMDVYLQDAASPYHPDARVTQGIHHHVKDTADVLRHDLVFHAEATDHHPAQDISLRILESAAVIFITVVPEKGHEILKLPVEKRAEEATFYADRILKRVGTFKRFMGEVKEVAYTWTFRHGPLEEGVWFSTDATERPSMMLLWANRVDGGIRKGRLFFWCWKKPEMTSGKALWSLDTKHWFDGEAYRQLNAPHNYPPGWK